MNDLKGFYELINGSITESYESSNTWQILNKLFPQIEKKFKDFNDLKFILSASITSDFGSKERYQSVPVAVMHFNNGLELKVTKGIDSAYNIINYYVETSNKKIGFNSRPFIRPFTTAFEEEVSKFMETLQKYE